MVNEMECKKNCADYRKFTIPEKGKQREIIAPDFKSRVQEYINKSRKKNG